MPDSEERVVIRNRPTPEGRMLGEQIARLTEVELARLRAKFPHHAEPCGTCAFRRGTVPNGCPATLMDALKCVIEGTEFMCHEHRKGEPPESCIGWFICTFAEGEKPEALRRAVAPWEFTREPTADKLARTQNEDDTFR